MKDASDAEIGMADAVSVARARTTFPDLLAKVEAGGKVTVTRRGKSIARILHAALGTADRRAGSRQWEPNDCDLSALAPMTKQEMAGEGWTLHHLGAHKHFQRLSGCRFQLQDGL